MAALEAAAAQAARAFPHSHVTGYDLVVRHGQAHVLEANAFGDLLPGLLWQGATLTRRNWPMLKETAPSPTCTPSSAATTSSSSPSTPCATTWRKPCMRRANCPCWDVFCRRAAGTRRHSPATFTYAAHQAFFAGFLPTPAAPGRHPRLFASAFAGSETTSPHTFTFEEADLPAALAARGYRTICIGGVGFFNKQTALGTVLPSLFQESHWSAGMGVASRHSTQKQVALADPVWRRRPAHLLVHQRGRPAHAEPRLPARLPRRLTWTAMRRPCAMWMARWRHCLPPAPRARPRLPSSARTTAARMAKTATVATEWPMTACGTCRMRTSSSRQIPFPRSPHHEPIRTAGHPGAAHAPHALPSVFIFVSAQGGLPRLAAGRAAGAPVGAAGPLRPLRLHPHPVLRDALRLLQPVRHGAPQRRHGRALRAASAGADARPGRRPR